MKWYWKGGGVTDSVVSLDDGQAQYKHMIPQPVFILWVCNTTLPRSTLTPPQQYTPPAIAPYWAIHRKHIYIDAVIKYFP